MVIAMSTIGLVLIVIALVLLLAFASGGAFSRVGHQTGERGGRGERIPEPPGFDKPRDGGLL